MTLDDLTPEIRASIKAIAARHGAHNVRVFGSVAENTTDQNSDLDLLIDYDLEKTTPWFPVRLIRDLESLLDIKVDVVTVNGLKKRIREEVILKAVSL